MNNQHEKIEEPRITMTQRILSLDWSKTPIGSRDYWPQSLRATIKILLGSRYPMILLWGEDLIQIYNDAYIALIGNKHPYALGRSIKETQAESWAVIGPMINEVMSTGISNWVPRQLLAVNRAGFNEETYFSLSYSAVENDDNEVSGMLCVCSEITQQVLAERRLLIQRDISAAANDATNIEKVFEDISAVASHYPSDLPFTMLYMLEEDQLLPRGVTRIAAGYNDRRWQIPAAIQGESVVITDVQEIVSITGGIFNDPVQKAVTIPIPSATPGKPLGVLVAGVNPNAVLDEHYLSFFQLLAGQISVAVRNALAYEEERKRTAYLAEIDRAKTAFFNNISHEFRTPLTLMLGPLQDILNRQAAAPVRETLAQVNIAYSNAVRLMKLVNTLLDFSRIEAHRMQATFAPTDLSRLTLELASSFESAFKKEQLFFHLDCESLTTPIYVDTQMWEKIVFNILSNALKFTFEGGITLRLYETATAAILEISDTGVGIPATELPKIFDRFHRVPYSRSRTHEGTGIGLALTRELVGMHGGQISVKSQEEKGSTFTVSIPKGSSHLDPAAISEESTTSNNSFLLEGYINEISSWDPAIQVQAANTVESHAVILVVDDNLQMAAYIQKILSRHWQVITARNGQEALAIIRHTPPDLVLSDVMMPVMNGFELLRAIRDNAATASLPIILLSARAGKEATIEGLEKGANDYLTKPFYADELVARVTTQLKLKKNERTIYNQQLFQEELEQLVRDRTVDLMHINAELEQFAFAASHDLQEPLRKIIIYGELLENAIPEDQQKLHGHLEKIMVSANRMRNLINDLLNFSRISSKDVTYTATDLNKVIDNLLLDLELPISRQQALIRYQDLPEIEAVPLQMQQLFFNLLSNALKFVDKSRTPVIDIYSATPTSQDIAMLTIHDPAATYVKIIVQDNGIGFDQKYANKIFTMFQKLHQRGIYAGTGIGLALCKKVIINHHGAIYASATEGQGATFTLILPLKQRHPDQLALPL